MPCRVLVRVPEARNLPVMDRQSESTDAFVEVRLGKDEDLRKSEVCRHSLDPHWDSSEWFQFELDDDELQDEPLQVRVIDHDKISSHDAIGRVYVPLGPLLVVDPTTGSSAMDGWFPIYDTLRGARGEVRVMVKLEMLVDANRYRQSSAGVRFCASNTLPSTYCLTRLHGFVEELVVNDDPEYQWIDTIRSKRKSNEERQGLFQKLSCELQRRVGVKVLEAGANAVLGYRQCIDLEGESGIVMRCIGTMAYLDVPTLTTPPFDSANAEPLRPTALNYTPPPHEKPSTSIANISPGADTGAHFVPPPLQHTPSEGMIALGLSGQVSSSYSEEDLQMYPTPAPPEPSSRRRSTKPLWFRNQISTKTPDFPFYTVSLLPAGVLVQIGGLVACRSVEYLGLIDNADEPESRDAWWLKLRREVLSHARAWGCNAVIGYEESMTMDEEVVVLSASGTAAIIQLNAVPLSPFPEAASGLGSAGMTTGQVHVSSEEKAGVRGVVAAATASANHQQRCSIVHAPVQWNVLMSRNEQSRCVSCNQATVPSLLLCSIDFPLDLAVIGQPCIIQSRVCRIKKKTSGEASAVAVSALLPFVESALHRQLISKLNKLKMNAVFGLHMHISVSEACVIAVATGTAVRLAALPLAGDPSSHMPGSPVKHHADDSAAMDTAHHVGRRASITSAEGGGRESSDSGRADRSAMLGEGRGSMFLDVDDLSVEDDGAVIGLAMDSVNMWWSTLQTVPGCPLPMSPGSVPRHLCVVQRVTVESPRALPTQLYRCLDNALQRLCYRAAVHRPCCVCKVEFDVMQCESGEEIQVTAKASVFALDPAAAAAAAATAADQKHVLQRADTAPILVSSDPMSIAGPSPTKAVSFHQRIQRFAFKHGHSTSGVFLSAQYPVIISSCDMIPGCHLLHHRAHICVFLIRESTSLREDHGSLGGMLHCFLVDAQALMRSHVGALGCNALLSFRLEVSELEETSNQGQCLLLLSGDAVVLSESLPSALEPSRDTAV